MSETRPPGMGLTFLLLAGGILLLAGGLVFLCAASEGIASRFLVALVLLVLGAGLSAWAGLRWRRIRDLAPDVVEGRIVALADAHDAELALSQILSDLRLPEEVARGALTRLEAQGLVRPERREERVVFTFPGLRESKVVRRCAYCGSEYSVRQPLHKCPNCGGHLEIVKT